MKRLFLVAVILSLVMVLGLSVFIIASPGFTNVGDDNLKTLTPSSPQIRVDSVWKIGDRIFIEKAGLILVPILGGESMLPLVSKGHKILVDPNVPIQDIQIGDFIVVKTLDGRYFHQVVDKRYTNKWALITRGVNNSEDDIIPVFQEDLVGVAIAVIW